MFPERSCEMIYAFCISFRFQIIDETRRELSTSSDGSFSQRVELHEPCDFCVIAVELDKPKSACMKFKRSSKPMKSFAIQLQKLAKEIFGTKQLHRV